MGAKLMPSAAILRYEVRALAASWLVRAWVIVSALVTLFTVLSQWSQLPADRLIASLFLPYLILPWFLPVIMIGAGSVSGAPTESLADSILSRPITRQEYLLAAWAGRVAAVLAAYAMVIVPAVLLIVFAARPAMDTSKEQITLYGSIATLVIVAMVLTLLVSLSLLLSVLLRRSLVAVLLLATVWPVSGVILGAYQLEEFSPLSLNQAIPTLLCRQSPWSEKEEPQADDPSIRLAEEVDRFVSIFQPAVQEQPARRERFFDRGQYDDLSLMRLALGYGVPTLLCVGLAAAWFSTRDL